MVDRSVWLPILLGILQGVIEWLPISSEGSVSVVLTLLDTSPVVSVRLALFLHAGTGVAALAYYREEIQAILATLPEWRRGLRQPFAPAYATTSFVVIATAVSVVVAGLAYLTLLELATALTGGAFIAVIGGLLVLTGVVQRLASSVSVADDPRLSLLDPVLVGIGQGIAILPGVSRSGTTASVLLLRGHSGPTAFRLSFLLSIPAAFGAGVLAVLEVGGIPTLAPAPALLALATSAVVGYATIDALMRVVRRLPFWAVCVALGSLAVAGGGLLLL